jgi:acetolactate synthase-1/2/3 large subunit
MWTAQIFKFNKPRSFVTSGGLGTMGFGFPAAMGACAGAPHRPVINIAGDGSIQMNIQEMMTCVDYGFKVINCVMNNGYLGMVRQWQEKLCEKHYSETKISSPDFVKLAESYGALGIRVEKEEEIIPALERALASKTPVMIDFIVESFEMVYPWVLAGQPLDNIILSDECEV